MKHLHPQEQFIQDRDKELQDDIYQDRKNDYLLKAYSKDRLEPNEEQELRAWDEKERDEFINERFNEEQGLCG